jgi:hypothetical protein
MLLALCAITVMSGCHLQSIHRPISLVSARIGTLVPHPKSRGCDACGECVPCRPFTCDYYPCWDNHITEHTAQKCAFRAYGDYKRTCGRPPSHHFKCGFIAAYEDLALNRKPIPPIIPPPKYWNAFYRSCAGEVYVDDWFAGYDAGLEMGLNSGVSKFQTIDIRRGNDCDMVNVNQGRMLAGSDIDQNQPVPSIPAPAATVVPRTSPIPYGTPTAP